MPTSEEELQRELLMCDHYFMDLETYTLSNVSSTIGEQAMSMKKGQGDLPEWMNAIAENIDYNVKAEKEMKMALYKAWVVRGNGDEWFV